MYRHQSSAIRVKLSILKPTQNRTNIMFYTAELKIRGERRAGELLATMEMQGRTIEPLARCEGFYILRNSAHLEF